MPAVSRTLALLAALGSALPVSAATVVIDFERLRHDDPFTGFHGKSYTEDGFTLSLDAPARTSYQSAGTQDPQRFNGSTALYSNPFGETTTLRRNDGGRFSLRSIDFAEIGGLRTPTTVWMVGIISERSTIMVEILLDGLPGPETVVFPANTVRDAVVTSWSWFGRVELINGDPAGFQFDNIVLDDLTVSTIVGTGEAGSGGAGSGDPADLGGAPVPLPGAAWLLASGLVTVLAPRFARGPRQLG